MAMTKDQATKLLASVEKHADGTPTERCDLASVSEALAIVGDFAKLAKFTASVTAAAAKAIEQAKETGRALGRKAECPLTKAELETFANGNATLVVDIGGTLIECSARKFSTGSYGFGGNGKVPVTVAGRTVKLQASLNLAIIGSGNVS